MGLAVTQGANTPGFRIPPPPPRNNHVGVPERTKGPACKAGRQGFESLHRLTSALVAQPGQSTWLRTKVPQVQILPSARNGVVV